MKNTSYLFIYFFCCTWTINAFISDSSVNETVELLKSNVLDHLLSLHNSDWGWNFGNTPRAVIAISLANETFFTKGDMISDIIRKQLQLEIAGHLVKQHGQALGAGQLALYINALIAVCEDPHDFFEVNLIKKLRHINVTSDYEEALKALTLCNAGHRLPKNSILALNNFLQNNYSTVYGNSDTQALALMALSCSNQLYRNTFLHSVLHEPVENLKKRQSADGSFGNIYTTALIMQALFSAGDFGKEWNLKKAIHSIKNQFQESSLHSSIMSHYFVLPVLNFKSLADLSQNGSSCNFEIAQPAEQVMSNEENDLWFQGLDNNILAPKNAVTLSLKCDYCHFQNYTISTVVVVDDGESLLQLMEKALLTDDSPFRFSTRNTAFGVMVESISGLFNDAHNHIYWMLYQLENIFQESKIMDKSVTSIQPKDNEHYIFWYKKV